MPLTSAAKRVLIFGHVKQGWLSIISRATVNSTFQGVLVARACQIYLPHDLAFDNQILKWVNDAAMEDKSTEKSRTSTQGIRGSRASAAEACWLAEAFGITIREGVRASLSNAVNEAAIHVAQNLSGIPAAGLVASSVQLCHIDLLKNIQKLLTTYLETANAVTIEDALSLHIASVAFAAPRLNVRARNVALRLRTRTGLFIFKESAIQPDLISTSYGYAASGGSQKDRARAENTFETPWGPALVIPAIRGNSPPVVNLASLAAGLSLLTPEKSMPLLY